MHQPLPPRRLSVEQLEERLTPTFGTPWFDGTSLTLSFVPDGTNISGQSSNLFALMGANATQTQWEATILRAYQTWAAVANINIGLVSDGGEAMGVAGAPQGDIRFGDIRIGARPLGAPGTPGSTIADAAGFDYNDQTSAGDLVFNSLYQFGTGSTAQQNDLFSVALHEAGHSLGLPDENTDPTSVMYNGAQGVLTGLSASDVAAIQALYGARPADQYQGAAGNGTLATATALGSLTAVSADLTQIGQDEVFQFTTPSSSGGATGLTINLQAAGISLLTSSVTVLDAQGNTVGGAVTTNPLNNNLSVTLPNYLAGATYYVKVQGSTSDVFSVGEYNLQLKYSGAFQSTSVTSSHYTNVKINAESSSPDGTLASAQTLAPANAAKATTFVLAGSISSPSDVDWYKFTPTAPTAFTGTLFIATMTTTNGLLPAITVYNAQGQLLPAVVTLDQGGSYEIQLANATTGTTYYIRVAASNLSSGYSTGMYTLGATLAAVSPTAYTQTATDSLTTAAPAQYTQLDVASDRLTQFAVTATGGSATAATAVRVTVYDATGHAVFTLVALAGQPIATGSVWLAAGTYSVVFNAATADGSPLGSLGVVLSSRALSDPLDPILVDPSAPPPPPPPLVVPVTAPDPTTTTTTTATTLVDPITGAVTTLVSPITSPFATPS